MDAMYYIYKAATLTIVSDSEDAGTSIYGVSLARVSIQVTLCHQGPGHISSKQVFHMPMGDSLSNTKAQCIQEMPCSNRLLILIRHQTFFRCRRTLYYENTAIESDGYTYESFVHRRPPEYRPATAFATFARSIVADVVPPTFDARKKTIDYAVDPFSLGENVTQR
jgi:hypothetical protein